MRRAGVAAHADYSAVSATASQRDQKRRGQLETDQHRIERGALHRSTGIGRGIGWPAWADVIMGRRTNRASDANISAANHAEFVDREFEKFVAHGHFPLVPLGEDHSSAGGDKGTAIRTADL